MSWGWWVVIGFGVLVVVNALKRSASNSALSTPKQDIIDGKRYDTGNATLVASDPLGRVSPSLWSQSGRAVMGMKMGSWRHLFVTKNGNLFLHTEEGISPVSKEMGMQLYQAFPEKKVQWESAFFLKLLATAPVDATKPGGPPVSFLYNDAQGAFFLRCDDSFRVTQIDERMAMSFYRGHPNKVASWSEAFGREVEDA